MKPKGTMIVMGGSIEMDIKKIAERMNESAERVILPQIINYAGGSESRIEILTCATNIPDEVWVEYRDIFSKLGVENVGNLFIHDKESADNVDVLNRIENADMLLFSGGDQDNIRKSIKGSKAHDLMMTRYMQDDIVIAGTSAGAMALTEVIILGEKKGNIYQKDDLLIDKGLSFLCQAIIDSHFTQRARLERLAEAVVLYPTKLGIGIGEDTALVIKNGNDCEVIGSGKVIFIDGSHIEQKKFEGNGEEKEAIPLFNLIVHILFPLDRFFINERKPVSRHEKRQYQE